MRFLIDHRGAASSEIAQLIDDLRWYDLLPDGAEPPSAASLFAADATWRLPIPGRCEPLPPGSSQGEAITLFDARGSSRDIAIALLGEFRGPDSNRPTDLIVDAASAAWLEILAAELEGERWAVAGDLGATGLGGASTLARVAFDLSEMRVCAFPYTAPGALLANRDCTLFAGGADGFQLRMRRPESAGSGEQAGGEILFEELLSFDSPLDLREPQPAPPFSHRIADDGSATILLPGRPGSYKLSIEVGGEEWSLFRLEDDEGRLRGQIATGPGIGDATYPLPLVQSGSRPTPLRLVRVHASKALRAGTAPRPVRRLWLSYYGEDFQEILPHSSSFESASLRQIVDRRIGNARLREERTFALAAGSQGLEIAVKREIAGDEAVPLHCRLGGGPVVHAIEESGNQSALPCRFEREWRCGIRRPSNDRDAYVWIADRPEAMPREVSPGRLMIAPPNGETRIAIVPATSLS